MDVIFQIHSIFGERVLPLLILVAAIWFTVQWKPNAGQTTAARVFPVLVDLQVGLGILYWVYLLIATSGDTQAKYLGFPFILHPITGILAAGLAHMAVGRRNPMASLGRWAPLASLVILLVMVIANIILARQV